MVECMQMEECLSRVRGMVCVVGRSDGRVWGAQ